MTICSAESLFQQKCTASRTRGMYMPLSHSTITCDYTHLTSWNTVVPEKLTVTQLINKLLAFCRT